MDFRTTLVNNLKSMESFETKLKASVIKALNKEGATVKLRLKQSPGVWELARINRYKRIFPSISVECKGTTVFIKSR